MTLAEVEALLGGPAKHPLGWQAKGAAADVAFFAGRLCLMG
jgi:hypothetical protein